MDVKQMEKSKLLKRNIDARQSQQPVHLPRNLHSLPIEDIESIFNTSIQTGLSSTDHLRNLNLYGPNEITKPKGKSLILVFLEEHLLSKFNMIASIAMVATLILGLFRGYSGDDISFIVVLSTIIAFTSIFTFVADIQRSNVIEKLQEIGHVSNALVKRNNKMERVNGRTLVPGDVVMLNMGDKIPADMIVLESQNLKVDDSSMTGESLPAKKSSKCTNANDALRSENVILYSTLVAEGSATGIVFATANSTKLAQFFNFEAPDLIEDTPMVKEINAFVYLSIKMAAVIVVILFGAAVIQNQIFSGIAFSISILISFIPEGLILSYLSAQTITANELSKKSIHVKKLKASEIFGNMTTLFMDKTGTITENKLHVSNFIEVGGEVIAASRYNLTQHSQSVQAIACGTDSLLTLKLKNKGIITDEDFENAKENALETCLLKFIYTNDANLTRHMFERSRRVYTMPFNSVNKYSYAIVDLFEDVDCTKFVKRMLFAKGAPEYLMKVCLTPYDGFFDHQMARYMTLANSGERAIALAQLDLTQSLPRDYDFESQPPDLKSLRNLEFLNIISMRDKIRDVSLNTIMNLRSAGINVVMVTGDHAGTARYVAKRSGIILGRGPTADEIAEERKIDIFDVSACETSAIVMTGAMVDKMPQERLRELFINFPEVVIARCSPQNKISAIEAMKSINSLPPELLSEYNIDERIIGVIGDGTNDAPALKIADIGISMGGNGTELTQEVALAIVKDDNTLGLLHAVKDSRQLRDNTLKGIAYMSRSLLVEMLPAIFMFFFNMVPLNMASIMIVQDIILSMIPNVSIAYEPTESDIMRHRPEKLRQRTSTSFAMILQNFFVYSFFGLVLSLTLFGLVYSTIGMRLTDTFYIYPLFSDRSLIMQNESGDLISHRVRMDVVNNGIMEYMKMNIIIQMLMLILSKTRRVSIFKHGVLNNPIMLAVVMFNMIVCLVITIVQVKAFSFIQLGFMVLIPLAILIVVYGSVLVIIFDEARKFIVRNYNLINFKSLMYHVYA